MAVQNGAIIAERYRLQRHLATGGMGAVWAAVDLRLDRDVAVKILKPEFSDDAEFLERFRAEARTTARLNHPGIAGVFDYGETTDPKGSSIPYLVMELVRGEPLNAVIQRMGTVPTQLVLDMLEQCGRALQVAHRAGLVHRDVKPGNILITPTGQVKITDFGIAKAVDAAPVTSTGMVLGTVQYIAPEQALGHEATAASDVYSLGVVGYEALAGKRPFTADTTIGIAQKHIGEPPPPLPPSVPAPVRELIGITLAKDPKNRYRNGGQFANAVVAVRSGRRPPRPGGTSGSATRPAPPPQGPPTGGTRPVGPPSRGTRPPGGPAQRPAPKTTAPSTTNPSRQWTTGQKVLAWSAALVLLAAAMITAGILFANFVGDGSNTRTSTAPTVSVPAGPAAPATHEPTPVVTTTAPSTPARPTSTAPPSTKPTSTRPMPTTTVAPSPSAPVNHPTATTQPGAPARSAAPAGPENGVQP